jgi:hypothetical protein
MMRTLFNLEDFRISRCRQSGKRRSLNPNLLFYIVLLQSSKEWLEVTRLYGIYFALPRPVPESGGEARLVIDSQWQVG